MARMGSRPAAAAAAAAAGIQGPEWQGEDPCTQRLHFTAAQEGRGSVGAGSGQG
jgi:hypothetical protein